MGEDNSGISFRSLFLAGVGAMALGLLMLGAAILWLRASDEQFARRADMARNQALLVARLEAEAAHALSLRPGTPTPDFDTAARAYLASIDRETDLIGQDDESRSRQAQEAATARRLLALIASGARGGDAAQARALARRITDTENAEAQAAIIAAQAAARSSFYFICAIMAALLALPLGLALLLWRHLVRPLHILARAADSVATETSPTRLPPMGLGEMRALIGHFNRMAQSVESRVQSRTAELETLYRQLSETDARRRLFLSKVSHELRTPVTVMRGEAEVALRLGGDAAMLRESLHHVLDSSLFLQRRLDDLLLLARAEDGALPLRHDPVDLAMVAQQAGRTVTAFANASGIRLELDRLDEAMPVHGDADRLHQALVALIDNGIKFSPAGGTIRLIGRRSPGYVGILVADEGPGVHDRDLQRIFDPYVQGDAGRALGGTGLGLSLARWIAQAHDGMIAADNDRYGEGLCVSLMLPARA